jgi:phage tail sheath protein FI
LGKRGWSRNMSTAYTYPGVYVEELPSSVRSIIGVGTSITAFVGRALKGPTDKATVIHSFADYSRIFGGLWKKSNMSYAVYHYFQNGGVDAIIVRVTKNATAAKFTPRYSGGANLDGLNLKVADPGVWGEKLDIVLSDADPAKKQDEDQTYFNISVYQKVASNKRGPLLEMLRNVSLDPEKPRFIGNLLVAGVSTYLRMDNNTPNPTPPVPEPDNGDGTQVPTVSKAVAIVTQIAFEKDPTYTLDAGSASDGDELTADEIKGDPSDKTGMYALKDADLFNLLCIPAYSESDTTRSDVYTDALKLCNERRAVLLIDPPAGDTNSWASSTDVLENLNTYLVRDKNGAIFFPRIVAPDPLAEYRLREFDPCGAVAGVIARTDAQRGVWKAPAGIEAVLSVPDLAVRLTNEENGELNPKGVNCLRIFPDVGRVIWGARTLRGADSLADQWKYLPVRRMALYIEETLYRGTQWVVFEPNDEQLWSQIRLNVGAFMHSLFVKGAFQGSDPKKAYLVKCDSETTTQTDIDAGIVNVLVGFAPLKPAEFVILKIQQLAGQESE